MGSPKSIVFGGERRVRVSSQCLKRTWRLSPYFRGAFAEGELGIRTKRIPEEVFATLGSDYPADARLVLAALFASLGKKSKGGGDEGEGADPETDDSSGGTPDSATPVAVAAAVETDHLLFLSRQEIDAIVSFARGRVVDLERAVKVTKKQRGVDPKGLDVVRKALKKHLAETCDRNAVDVALFGRFLTSDEFGSCDAALQVAHALGTEKLSLEYDYFTAVDDRKPQGETGAGHLGETELCASVFYEYAVCDVEQLTRNLGGDAALAGRAMKAIALAMCRSVFEKAKRNGTAPHTPADHLEIVVRSDAPVSLANAFLKPVRPEHGHDVMDVSIARLRAQAAKYDRAYGAPANARFIFSLRDVAGVEHTHTTFAELGNAVEALVVGSPRGVG